MALTIVERDVSGEVTSTYVYNSSRQGEKNKRKEARAGAGRVDVIKPKNGKPYFQRFVDVFLPAGYPGSVTSDYTWYQIYDSLQAFSSSIASLLSNRAVLEGVGVGDANATPTAALLLSIMKDSVGRVATILFAYRFGTSIEPECKMYRLAADFLNDAAIVLDCLSPAFPRTVRTGVLCASGVLRALCGVAAGSAKSCLSAHFATCGNLGDLNAKDSSQETVISLMGMLTGSLVVARITSPLATWSSLLVLLSIHLAMNYAAVRAVCLRTLNRQRASMVISALADHGRVLTPHEVSRDERIFEWDGLMRWGHYRKLGHCRVGAPLALLLRSISQMHATTGSFNTFAVDIADVVEAFQSEQYILWLDRGTRSAVIVLKEGATARDQLRAWTHALLIARRTNGANSGQQDALALLGTTMEETSALLERFVGLLEDAGWDLDTAALETRSGTRISTTSQE